MNRDESFERELEQRLMNRLDVIFARVDEKLDRFTERIKEILNRKGNDDQSHEDDEFFGENPFVEDGSYSEIFSEEDPMYDGPPMYDEEILPERHLFDEMPEQDSVPRVEGEEGMQARPVYVAAIDLASSEEFLELTKSGLLAALEALKPGSLFGLATFSHKLGLYDVQGPIPVVKNVFLPGDADGTLSFELEDAMPLFSFLAPVETCKDRIASALETLRPTSSWEGPGTAQGMGGRGFGLAMESLISYLGSEHGNTYALARIFAFLSGPPDYGPGQLDTRRYGEQYASKGEDAELALLPEQTPFYKDLAAVAVQAGVCIDIFAVTNEYTDLASLKFLSIDSGGSLFLYPNTDDSTLPQDMYRILSRPYAFNCVMRLRTSSEFKPGNSYGHFFPDPQYENVQHVICCDSYATYAYDFDFANNYGFSRHTSELPMIQLAFQYTVVVPPEEHPTPGSGQTSRSKYTLKKRLRIRTMQFGVAHNFNELYDGCDLVCGAYGSCATNSFPKCEKLCLKNCSCMAYANIMNNGGNGCLLWMGDLLDIQEAPSFTSEIYIRLAFSELGVSGSRMKKQKIIPLIFSLVVGLSLILGLTFFVWIKWKKSSTLKGEEEQVGNDTDQFYTNESQEEDLELPLFNLSEIAKATHNFSFNNKLGEGGYGPVYKGVLQDRKEVAVKRVNDQNHTTIQIRGRIFFEPGENDTD